MTPAEAQFRKATLAEIEQAKGSLIYRFLSFPISYAFSYFNGRSVRVLEKSMLNREISLIQEIKDLVLLGIGMKPDYHFLREKPALFGSGFLLRNQKVIKAFKKTLSSDLWDLGEMQREFMRFMISCFPDSHFSLNEDVLLPFKRQLFGWMGSKFQPNAITETLSTMRKMHLAEFALSKDSHEEIDLRSIISRYSASVFGKLFLNETAICARLIDSLPDIKSLLILQRVQGLGKEEKQLLSDAKDSIREKTEAILNLNPQLFEGIDTTKENKQALLFFLLFETVEKITNLVTLAIGSLSTLSDPELSSLIQEVKNHLNLDINSIDGYPLSLREYLRCVLMNNHPMPVFDRTAKVDLCLQYCLMSECSPRTLFIPKGSTVAASLHLLQAGSFAESLESPCPGKYLSGYISLELMTAFLSRVMKDSLNQKIRFEMGLAGPLHQDLSFEIVIDQAE